MTITIVDNSIAFYQNNQYIGRFRASGYFVGNVSINCMIKEIYGDSIKGLIPNNTQLFKSIPK